MEDMAGLWVAPDRRAGDMAEQTPRGEEDSHCDRDHSQ
jgi:hypothetical protein